MAQIRTVGRRKRRRRRRRRPDEEERVKPRPAQIAGDRLGMMALQQRVGNQAVQRMLMQRQAEEKEKTAEAQTGVGQIKIERPKFEYYDVSGDALADVLRQAQEEKDWRQEEYKYEVKSDQNGVVTEVNVTVQPIIKLPRWVGPGWEKAPDGERLAWLELLESLNIDQEMDEETTDLPRQWGGVDWAKAPPALKSGWQTMIQSMHKNEQQSHDIIRRRALVLQQRLLGRPEAEAKSTFDRFQEDLKVEQEAYSRQEEFGQAQKISLGANVMVQ